MSFNTPMSAAQVANLLRGQGLTVYNVEEGDDQLDGAVHLHKDIYVNVPSFGGPLSVDHWIEKEQAIQHYPDRTSIADIVSDYRKALTS
jgi:hypothetical protein